MGLLWKRFQPEYPVCEDVVPITPIVEIFDNQNVEPQLKLTSIPPLPRVWLISQDGTKIIQIQRDRFVHNWRKVNSGNEYPRYNSLIKDFQGYLSEFIDFLNDAELEQIQPTQYELTYVNRIPQGQGWSALKDIGQVFPDISWQVSSSRFLANPQSVSWATVFELPDKTGRLHASVTPDLLNERPTIVFELTVRGIGQYNSWGVLQNWFDIAHQWIVCAFADLTNQATQTQIWKRRG
jgi:uncharacterized protein (TIGR04255 family)